MDIESVSSTAKNCIKLLVDTNTINILGRYAIGKPGLHLAISPKQKKGEQLLFNISNTHQKTSKWMFNKYQYVPDWADSIPHNTKEEVYPYIYQEK